MELDHATLFKERLYYFIKENNLTMNRLATLSGIAPTTLSSIVNRGSAPRIDTIYKICNGLNVSVCEFFNFPPYNEVEEFH
jgi:transcriptional regulator with XRE-family HTH domain